MQQASSDIALWFAVNQFYTREARLLDDLQFKEWLTLLADDIVYWMPTVSNRVGRDVGRELSKPGELAHFEDDKKSLTGRVKRLETGMAWAETPPGRTRHLVTNVEAEDAGGGLVKARSSFLIWRSHLETDQEIFSGIRLDLLRRTRESFEITKREIRLDHAVLTQKSLGIFF